MTRYPVFVNGNISFEQFTSALRQAGFTVKSDLSGRTIVDEVPQFLKRTDGESHPNVVKIKGVKR